MLVGSRVVRGPDWEIEEEEDHDGGEGCVGTVTSVQCFKDGSPLTNKTVLVLWDNGFQACYRAGNDECYDLRVLDSSPAGVKFSAYLCDGCNQSGIAGMRWHCTDCPDYNLCTVCYMNDVHNLKHSFERFDISNDSANGVHVKQRSGSSKIQSKGIFPGAIVKTGQDWTSEALGIGVVLELDSWKGIPRSAVKVDWVNFCELLLRVGHGGKVDLELVQPSFGPFYYNDHLPTVSLDDIDIQKKLISTSMEQAQRKPSEPNQRKLSEHAGPINELKQRLQKIKPSENMIKKDDKEVEQRPLPPISELMQRLQKIKPSENMIKKDDKEVKHRPLPPFVFPKPSPRSRDNKPYESNMEGSGIAQPPTVQGMIKQLSSQTTKDDSSAYGKTSSKPYAAPSPPALATSRVDPSEATPKRISRKSRPAPAPPRPRSEIYTGVDNTSTKVDVKEARASGPTRPPRPLSAIQVGPDISSKANNAVPPSRGNVASLIGKLSNLIPLDPTKGRPHPKEPAIRELICTTCDEKASKVIFEPCGHHVEVVCQGCAWKMKRCQKCNLPIEKKTTPDGTPLAEPYNEMGDSNNEKVKELEKQLEEMKREVECPICMDERRNILFSCGHGTCKECSDVIGQNNNKCPICKKQITERTQTY